MSILVQTIKHLMGSSAKRTHTQTQAPIDAAKCVLNVGGNSKLIAIPHHYFGWRHDLLDIDPRGSPDIICDARELHTQPGGRYDAVYCSHNLEHYYRHHCKRVLHGFGHMLKTTGFVELRVPDILQVVAEVKDKGLELDDVLYESASGPMTAHDVIYGYHVEIERSNQDFFAHKMGFTPKSLTKMLGDAGFVRFYVYTDYLTVHALAFKSEPSIEHTALLESFKKIYSL